MANIMSRGRVVFLSLAILVGALNSGFLAELGLFAFMDDLDIPGAGRLFQGLVPAFHRGTPWGFTPEMMPDLSGKVVIITGANVGLGYWTAYHIAAANGTAILACRTMSRCVAAAESITDGMGGIAIPMELDLASFASVRNFVQLFLKDHSFVDSLILNAGLYHTPFELTAEGLELQIGTNHFGHFLLAELLTPILKTTAKAKGSATVVIVSSTLHRFSYPEGILPTIDAMTDVQLYDPHMAYGQSKLANIFHAQELAARLNSSGVLVNAVHPGFAQTRSLRYSSSWLEKLLQDNAGWHPRDAAWSQVCLAVAPAILEQKVTGKYFHPIAREAVPHPPYSESYY